MFYAPPATIETTLFAALPEQFRKAVRTPWADANKAGEPVDCFLEGPAFDRDGALHVTDIPHGRVFRLSAAGEWQLVAEYDGWPNGLKFLPDGGGLITDYKRGLMRLDSKTAAVTPFLSHRNSEAFKGLNDLFIAPSGDIWFTDQGQTGLHDPTGRVYRLRANGQLDLVLANVPSPNGIVLDQRERVLFVAATRGNAVWRAPLMPDGGVAKVGLFVQLYGSSGPDGLALDDDGNLLVAHASLGAVFVFSPKGECIARHASCAGPTTTNLAIAPDRRMIFITESSTGSVLRSTLRYFSKGMTK
jgi:gluconolactonase